MSALESQCIEECQAECNLVSFPFNSVDVEGYISQGDLDKYKLIISGKFNITGQTDAEIKKRMTWLKIFFDKSQTTR